MIKKKIYYLLTKALLKAFPKANAFLDITPSTQGKFGHYQCNTSMKLAKELQMNPRAIAEQWVAHLEDQEGMFAEVSIAGPGFINMTLGKEYLSSELDRAFRDSKVGVERSGEKKRIVVEFSSPNVAKEMHVGHLRSTIIGDALARLFEFLGHEVIRLNHVGDWGTAFGMLIAYMKEEVPDVLVDKTEATLSSLMEWYRASKKRFDEDQIFKKKARLEVVALQGGDPAALKAWGKICAISRKAFQEVYDLLDVKIEERGESYYNPVLSLLIADLEKKGLITLSEGAKCLFIEGYDIPLMMQKSDGGFGYDTTDVAAMRQRVQEEKADRIVIVTDAGQSLHFSLVYEACVKAGYLDPQKVRFDHVPFGLVLGPDGKKFRTRSGETERLMDLLNKAVQEADRILWEREPGMLESERVRLAHLLGVDAIKYADLSCNRIGDYVFSYERMLRFEGNTAAFVLYAYVRIAGIKRKVGVTDVAALSASYHITLEHPSEIDLGLHLLRFDEALETMGEELLPNVLTEYLYVLAQKFNAFFRDCRVEGAEEEKPRLLLCEAAARIMGQGLHILGLHTVDRM